MAGISDFINSVMGMVKNYEANKDKPTFANGFFAGNNPIDKTINSVGDTITKAAAPLAPLGTASLKGQDLPGQNGKFTGDTPKDLVNVALGLAPAFIGMPDVAVGAPSADEAMTGAKMAADNTKQAVADTASNMAAQPGGLEAGFVKTPGSANIGTSFASGDQPNTLLTRDPNAPQGDLNAFKESAPAEANTNPGALSAPGENGVAPISSLDNFNAISNAEGQLPYVSPAEYNARTFTQPSKQVSYLSPQAYQDASKVAEEMAAKQPGKGAPVQKSFLTQAGDLANKVRTGVELGFGGIGALGVGHALLPNGIPNPIDYFKGQGKETQVGDNNKQLNGQISGDSNIDHTSTSIPQTVDNIKPDQDGNFKVIDPSNITGRDGQPIVLNQQAFWSNPQGTGWNDLNTQISALQEKIAKETAAGDWVNATQDGGALSGLQTKQNALVAKRTASQPVLDSFTKTSTLNNAMADVRNQLSSNDPFLLNYFSVPGASIDGLAQTQNGKYSALASEMKYIENNSTGAGSIFKPGSQTSAVADRLDKANQLVLNDFYTGLKTYAGNGQTAINSKQLVPVNAAANTTPTFGATQANPEGLPATLPTHVNFNFGRAGEGLPSTPPAFPQ